MSGLSGRWLIAHGSWLMEIRIPKSKIRNSIDSHQPGMVKKPTYSCSFHGETGIFMSFLALWPRHR